MKHSFAALCVLVSSSTASFSQSPAEKDPYEELGKGDVHALESVVETPDKYSALILYEGACVAFQNAQLEDSAFLFYAGQLRARFDRECFPPRGTGGNSPFVAYAALSQEIGSTINPAIMAEPKTFAKVMHRVEKWTPKAPKAYTPGYEFKERLSVKDAHEAAKPNRTELLRQMGDLSKLLNDAEYFAAFRIVQAYNLASDDIGTTTEQNDKAMETMRRIEKDKGLKGFFSE